tara:strand:- start:436 stop:1389 length:954 start_codon:yes stop_codon:yes gene_type:complete
MTLKSYIKEFLLIENSNQTYAIYQKSSENMLKDLDWKTFRDELTELYLKNQIDDIEIWSPAFGENWIEFKGSDIEPIIEDLATGQKHKRQEKSKSSNSNYWQLAFKYTGKQNKPRTIKLSSWDKVIAEVYREYHEYGRGFDRSVKIWNGSEYVDIQKYENCSYHYWVCQILKRFIEINRSNLSLSRGWRINRGSDNDRIASMFTDRGSMFRYAAGNHIVVIPLDKAPSPQEDINRVVLNGLKNSKYYVYHERNELDKGDASRYDNVAVFIIQTDGGESILRSVRENKIYGSMLFMKTTFNGEVKYIASAGGLLEVEV